MHFKSHYIYRSFCITAFHKSIEYRLYLRTPKFEPSDQSQIVFEEIMSAEGVKERDHSKCGIKMKVLSRCIGTTMIPEIGDRLKYMRDLILYILTTI